MHTIQPVVFRRTVVNGFDSSLFETKQVFVDNSGVKIPCFIIARKGTCVKEGRKEEG